MSEALVISDVEPQRMYEKLGIEVNGEGSINADMIDFFKMIQKKDIKTKKPKDKIGEINFEQLKTYESTSIQKPLLKLFVFENPVSTQNISRALDAEGQKREVVVAVQQTDGQGYANRDWYSAPGNLHFTVSYDIQDYIPGNESAVVSGNIQTMSPVIITKLLADSLKKLLGNDIFGENKLIISPFNDLVFNLTKKIAGVLINGEQIGMGINFIPTPLKEKHKTGVTQSTACLDDILCNNDLVKKNTPIMLVNEFMSQLKHFSQALDNASDKFGRVSLMLKMWEDYQNYFINYIRGNIIKIFDSTHKNILGEGVLIDVERDMSVANWMKISIINQEGTLKKISPGGIHITNKKNLTLLKKYQSAPHLFI